MKNLILILLFPFALTGQKTFTVNAGKARFVFDDKAYHYYLSGFISSSNAYGMYQLNDRIALCGGFGFGVGVLVGTAKELHDRKTTGFSKEDFLADVLGSGGGWFGFAVTLDQMYRNKTERKIYKSVPKK